MVSRRINMFLGLFAVSALAFSIISAAPVDSAVKVNPGDMDHFTVKVPERAIAGENFVIRLEPRDAYDNIITDYSRLGGSVKLTSSGKGKISPDVINPSDFFEGVAQILVSYDKAEAIILTAKEELTNKTGAAKIALGPGAVDHFSLSAPSQITAGQKFPLKIEARDLHENIVTDYNLKHSGVEINPVVVSGEKGRLYPNTVPGSNFNDGSASLDLVYEKTGSIIVSVNDLTEKASGKTSPLPVQPGEAKRFIIMLPDKISAGKPFAATVKVFDAFDNLVTNYSKTGKGVSLNPQAQGKLTPDEIPASAFADGIATVNLTYNKAEMINPIVIEKAVKESKAPEAVKEPATPVAAPSAVPAETKKPAAKETKPKKEEKKPAAAAKPAEAKPAEVKPAEAKPKEVVADPKAEAKNCYDRAVKYIGQRKYQDAKNELERCLSLDPTNTDAKKLLDRVNIIMRLEAK